ncbi:MAG TPA: acetate--CoA ligase family protein [Candidatus Dormibacteraeota bacterium]|nr:acetate--CoA ligase family protein [Candidatus Dormibacteraeota bacterium]
MQVRADIERFLHPRGVALLGPVPRGAGAEAWLRAQSERWGDRFHLVDPSGGDILGVPVYPTVGEVPDPVDLAVISVRRELVLAAAEACGRRGIANLLVRTAGFSEIGPEGAELERRLLGLVRRHGMRLLGPNTNTNLFEPMPPPSTPRIGRIGLVTQSGHLGRVVVQAAPYGVAFSRWVPTGNEADLEVADFIEYFAYDDETAVIAGYFEGFRDGAKLRRALAAANRQGKPVVAIKVGRSPVVGRAAVTHTAHLTGADAVVDGLFKQYGVIRVDDLDELIEVAALLAKAPAPAGPGVALYGISGGAGAMMVDLALAQGLRVPTLGEETQRRLRELIPSHLNVSNPIDNGGELPRSRSPEERRRALEIICADPAVDLLVVALTAYLPGLIDNFVADLVEFVETAPVPIVATWNSWEADVPAFAALVASGVPVFRSFRGCFRAISRLLERQRRLARAGRRQPVSVAPRGMGRAGPWVLGPAAASELLASRGLCLPRQRMVSSVDAARAAAEELGYPVVLKCFPAGHPHKSEAGLVRTGLGSAAEVELAYRELEARGRELAPGTSPPLQLQEHVGPGVEMIIGVTRDEVLGPAVLVGLGGIFAEVLDDVSVRPLPITPEDAEEMLRELRGFPLLEGARGAPPADLAALAGTLLTVAEMAADGRLGLRELDLNPVIATSTAAVVVDAVVVLDEGRSTPWGRG